ncbi:hypothetical protein BDW62DRAFT_213270 [Aspergillus aurantiobrunneus]
MILKTLATLGRLGAFTSSIIVLCLNAKFITEGSWLRDFLIYIEVIAAVSVIAALIPPYPNFLYDSFWGAAWIVAAIFALVAQFAESNCYGLRPESQISCASYKAGTAFAFLALFVWLGSAFLEDETVPLEKLRRVEVLYAGPAFARYLIGELPIPDNVRIELKNPTNDSIGATVESNVRVPAAGDVTFYPMNVFFFFADDPDYTPIASVDLPELKYGSGERLTISEQRLKLEDLDAFARFIKAVAFNPSFTLGSRSRAKIKVGTISTWVDLHKTVEFTGSFTRVFNAFPTLNITDISLEAADDYGYNVHAKIAINNPTPTSATFGNVTLDLLVGDIILGEARASVANIIPGENVFDVDAKLNITNLQDHMETILEIEVPYLKNEEVLASASVTSVVYEGQHLAYWEEAFGRLEVTLTRPVRPLVQSVMDSGFLRGTVGSLAEQVLNTILDNVKDMDEEDLEQYTARLGDRAVTMLDLLSTLGIL